MTMLLIGALFLAIMSFCCGHVIGQRVARQEAIDTFECWKLALLNDLNKEALDLLDEADVAQSRGRDYDEVRAYAMARGIDAVRWRIQHGKWPVRVRGE